MKKYNVVFALSYEIQAEDDKEAIEKAEEFFENDCSDRSLFGINAEVKD